MCVSPLKYGKFQALTDFLHFSFFNVPSSRSSPLMYELVEDDIVLFKLSLIIFFRVHIAKFFGLVLFGLFLCLFSINEKVKITRHTHGRDWIHYIPNSQKKKIIKYHKDVIKAIHRYKKYQCFLSNHLSNH